MIRADARHIPLKDESVQTVVTSPPYWGLRDYGIEPSVWGHALDDCTQYLPAQSHEWGDDLPGKRRDQQRFDELGERLGCGGGHKESNANHGYETSGSFCIHCSAWRGVLGLEPTPELYVQHIVEVFREVRRVLREDGTVFLNLGDSYCTGTSADRQAGTLNFGAGTNKARQIARNGNCGGLKPKDLVGIPWRVAFALQADGWWLRSDIIWSKPNPMPESVTDRPTKSHEYIFLLSKSADYFYDGEAIREPEKNPNGWNSFKEIEKQQRKKAEAKDKPMEVNYSYRWGGDGSSYQGGRNKRTVWEVATQPYPDAHFATFPEDLIKPCILAGSPVGGKVLDPFAGSGTTVKVAQDLGRVGIGLDLKPDYLKMAKVRTAQQGLRF